jgi:hypothetical protein
MAKLLLVVSSEKSLKIAKVAMFGLAVLGAAIGVVPNSVSPGGW